jgi:hypothetical protein
LLTRLNQNDLARFSYWVVSGNNGLDAGSKVGFSEAGLFAKSYFSRKNGVFVA